MFQPSDVPFLVDILRRKNEHLGISFWMPPLKQARCVLVAERNGAPQGALVFSDVTELTLVGDTPSVIRTMMHEQERIRLVAGRSGISDMVLFVPNTLMSDDRTSAMELIAKRMRFRRIDDRFAAFEGEIE